jgi:hypothetical protein
VFSFFFSDTKKVFTLTGGAYFFVFDTNHMEVVDVLRCLLKLRPPNMADFFSGGPPRLSANLSNITELWRRREISNFTYLMELNTFAGILNFLLF